MASARTAVRCRPVWARRDRRDDLLRAELPLRDLEFAVEAYLLAHGARLDTATRLFLADLRDGVGTAARRLRDISDEAEPSPEGPPSEAACLPPY